MTGKPRKCASLLLVLLITNGIPADGQLVSDTSGKHWQNRVTLRGFSPSMSLMPFQPALTSSIEWRFVIKNPKEPCISFLLLARGKNQLAHDFVQTQSSFRTIYPFTHVRTVGPSAQMGDFTFSLRFGIKHACG